MSFYPQAKELPQRFRLVLSSFLQHDGLPFAKVLPEEAIQQSFEEDEGVFAEDDDNVYTPAVTLWAFLSQVLFKGEQRSCVAAVSRVVVLWLALGRGPCSDNTGAYCRARAKLPVAVIRRLATTVAQGCEQKVPDHWLWLGRHVYLVDGTTASMPDTPENQEAYPQPPAQQPGLGFPLVRLLVLVSLATAMLKDMASGPYAGKESGESALLRELLAGLVPGDIILGDRYYCSYFMIALLLDAGIDIVTRSHQCRTHFRRIRRLGPGDYLVAWARPQKPEWMDQATYERMPPSLQVRQLQVQVKQPGFRVEEFTVVTSLVDADTYSKNDLAELYHQRWLAELDIRALKITLGMDVLRCKSPEMVRRETWTCLLAYNLIRQTMLEAALASERSPRQLSFTAAMQKIAASWGTICLADHALLVLLVTTHLEQLPAHRVANRPNRVEPRAVKRRPKPHKLLTKPRAEARAELLAGAAT